MIDRPHLDPRYDLHPMPGQGAILLSETGQIALEGPIYADLLALVDGQRDWAAIRAELSPVYGALALMAAMGRLVQGGFVCEAADIGADSGFWATLGLAPADLAARRADRRLHLAVIGADPAPLQQALQDLGVGFAEDDAALSVVLAQDLLDPGFAAVNARFRQAGRRWMALRIAGTVAWIGPVFDPDGACWACFAHRAGGNRPVAEFLSVDGIAPAPPAPCTALSQQAAAGVAALTIARRLWLDEAEDALITLDLTAPKTQRHAVIRRPQCPVCGDPQQRAVPDQGRAPFGPVDGGYRTTFPEATEARLRPYVSPITGVITKLEPYDLNSPYLNVYRADHRLFRPTRSLRSLRDSLRGSTAGKGRTASQARVSALCEAVERYSGAHDGTEPRLHARLGDLGGRGIHPADCLLFSDRQYDTREDWNRQHSNFAWVPMRFDPDRAIDWTPCQSLVTGEDRLLPAALCWYDVPMPADHQFAAGESNGCASGNSRDEAILQGFMELVERDSVALWWYNRAPRPGVDLDALDDPWLQAMLAEYARLNREIWAIDLTADLGIPAYAVISRRMDAREEVIQGYGAHFDARIALSRALTECTQMLAHLNQEGAQAGADPDLDDWFENASIETEPYLRPDPRLPPRPLPTPAPRGADLRDEVARCVAAVKAAGLDMLVLDQTRPDIGFPVVRVTVPGLRHFWARLAPGRLYDVPQQLGWVDTKLTEDALNPRPICS